MRRTVSIAILAVLALFLTTCRVDHTAKQAEGLDSGKSIPAAEQAAQRSAEPAAAQTAPPAAEASLPAPPLPAAVVNDKRPVIVCFGDSLTAGYGAELGKSYPDYLQADLDARGYHYRVVNQGISGNTTKDGVERLDSTSSP